MTYTVTEIKTMPGLWRVEADDHEFDPQRVIDDHEHLSALISGKLRDLAAIPNPAHDIRGTYRQRLVASAERARITYELHMLELHLYDLLEWADKRRSDSSNQEGPR